MQRLYGMDKIYLNPRVISAYVWDHYLLYKYVVRHPIVKWFIENIEDGHGLHKAKMIVGPKDKVYAWDGGDCQAFGLRRRDSTGEHFYDRRAVFDRRRLDAREDL
ncbi:hypothetical protein EXIGLDRAFT_828503 [Exidia glandulosa HHB12029]|uniref:Uncharacterized protein n=1 Tax=Exidia glandulosa HHB12029 TaxID=1314781 RepID=A0A165QI90_EXIGL|nr:hypothetical protein EXIGLDRAFT_828503 [Exidia glandulosa HHB12029]